MVYKERNDLELNIDKCYVITFTRERNIIVYDYSIGGRKLQRVDEIKDLGIVLDSKLCFDKHVNYIFRKCSKLLGFVFRACRNFRAEKSFLFLFNSLIRSILEYGSVVRNPFYNVYVDKIEIHEASVLQDQKAKTTGIRC